MKLKAAKIANIINGTLIGDPEIIVSSCSDIKKAKKGDITFLADKRYQKYLKSTKASIIIVPNIDIKLEKTMIKVDNPAKRFTQILNVFFPQKPHEAKIAKTAKLDNTIKIGSNVLISDYVIIEKNVIIGDNCVISPNTFIGSHSIIESNSKIGPNVTIYNGTEVGVNCIIHAGAVIGSDGFGFIKNNKEVIKMPQIGKVIIRNNVEIGANTTIDRGTLNNTIIDNGVKLDNLIQIGHNVIIGENTIIAAQTGIAGSTQIGKNCMIGGQVAVSDHISIGDNVKIAGNSGVIKNVPNNKILQGHLAFDIKDFQKSYVHFKNLKQIVADLTQLKEIEKIAKNNSK